MEKSQVIYKIGNGYVTNGSVLMNKIRSGLDTYLLQETEKMKRRSDNDLFISRKTEMGNEFQIYEVEIPLDKFFILNHQYHSVDHDVKVIVNLSVKIRESIVE